MSHLLFADLKGLDLDIVTKRSIEKLRRDLGPVIMQALQNDSVTEIMLNPNKTIWTDSHGVMEEAGDMGAGYSESLIKMVASCVKEEVGPSNPLLECELPFHGARFEGLLPPVVANPTISIRKHASVVYTLQHYVDSKILTEKQRDFIEQAVKDRKNILIAGSTGSGKTTFTNAVIKSIEHIHENHRLIVIEDTNELQIEGKNNVIIRSNTNFCTLKALKATMRLRPDRIIVGEVRGGEALTLLKSWNTGHSGGACTVHANGAAAALIRLEQLISEVSTTPMHHLIAEAVDIVIFIQKEERHPAGRVIREIAQLASYTNGQYQIKNI